jgi:hypothetical protein
MEPCMRHNYTYRRTDLNHYATIRTKHGKDPDSAPARRPQSTSAGRYRSAVPNRRFLRRSRFAAGQVRDAAARRCRPIARHRGRGGLRTVTACVLSRPACICSAGPGRADSPKARPSRRAQTDTCGPGLRAPATRGIALVDDWRTHERCSAGVWAGSSQAHSRAAFGPAGKKTSLISATTNACSQIDLRGLYEQLRRRVLEGGRRVPGCALIQRQGMKGWIESCLQFFRLSVPVCVPHEPPATEIPFCDDVVHLIASMVLEIHRQGAIS